MAAQIQPFNAQLNVPFTTTVATFTDNTNLVAGNFSATINWGDGTVSSGITPTGGNGNFSVAGSHTYTTGGQKPVSVIIDGVNGTIAASDAGTGQSLGYISNQLNSGNYQLTTDPNSADLVACQYDGSSTFNVADIYAYYHGVSQYFIGANGAAGGYTLGSGRSSYVNLVGTSATPGNSTPDIGGSESHIWSLVGNNLVPQWINLDGSKSTTYPTSLFHNPTDEFLLLTGDPAVYATSGHGVSSTIAFTLVPSDTANVGENININPVSTTTTVSTSANPIVAGNPLKFQANVSSSAASFDNGGSVQFQVNGSNFGSPAALNNGVAQIDASSLGSNSTPYAVTAIYSGDATFLGSNGSLLGGEAITSSLPSVQFATGSETINQGAGSFSIPVTLSAPATQTVTVPILLSGSAVAGRDYANIPGVITIAAGQTTGSVTGTLIADPGSNRTLTMRVGDLQNATPGTTTVNTLTIDETAVATSLNFSVTSVNALTGVSIALSTILSRADGLSAGIASQTVTYTASPVNIPSVISSTATGTTDLQGNSAARLTLPSPGTYLIHASFGGNAALAPTTAAALNAAAYQPTSVTLQPIAATTVGTPTSISAKLVTTSSNTPIAGQTVTFSFSDGQPPMSALTNVLGVATVSRTSSNSQTYRVTASFFNPAGYFTNAAGTIPAAAASDSAIVALSPPSQANADNTSIDVSETVTAVSTTVSNATAASGNLMANDDNLVSDPSAITQLSNSAHPQGATAAADGSITLDGTYGTLTVQTAGAQAGNYTYSLDNGVVPPSGAADTFTYTLTDNVGNASSANLVVGLNVSSTIQQINPTVTATAVSGTYNGNPYPASATVLDANGNPLNSPAAILNYYTYSLTNIGKGIAVPQPGVQSPPQGKGIITPPMAYLIFPTTTPPTDAGSYAVMAEYPGSTYYAHTVSNPAFFTISQAAPTITVTSTPGGVYNGNAVSTTAAITGINATPLDAQIQYFCANDSQQARPIQAPSAVGSYVVVISYPGGTDYAYASQTIPFAITPATPSISVTDLGGSYNGSVFAASATVAGVANTPGASLENVALTLDYVNTVTNQDLGAAAPIAAGSYSVTAIFAGSADYTGNSASTTFSIGKATSSISVNDAGGSYNGSAFAASATVTGISNTPGTLLENTGLTLDYVNTVTNQDLGAAAPTAAGSYSVTAIFAGSADYTPNSASKTFSISKATPSISVNDAGGVYSGSPFAATASVTGVSLVPGSSLETVGLTLDYVNTATKQDLGASAPTAAGSYRVTANFPGSSDYTSNAASTTFTIGKAGTTVGVTDNGGAYTGAAFPATAALATGAGGLSDSNLADFTFVYAGTGATVYTPTTAAPTAAGTYSVTATYIGDANHNGSSSPAAGFTIAKAAPTVAVTALSGAYNASAYAATATVNGVASLEGVSPTLTYYAGATATGTPLTAAPINVGTYTVVAKFAGSADYLNGSATKTFTITQTGSTLRPVAATTAYGAAASLSTTLTTTAGVILAGRTVTFSLNGKVIGTAVTNASGVATLAASTAGISPGVYASAISVSFAGDSNSTAASATTSLTVTDAPIVAKGSTLSFLNIALTLGTFTQARTNATASDFVVSVNWGDGSASQNALVIADPLHAGQFDIVGPLHLYSKLRTNYTVTVTISTVGKFGAVAGATTTFTTVIQA